MNGEEKSKQPTGQSSGWHICVNTEMPAQGG